ncbi:MAG: MBL fold metallo-hydrolase [Actinomycetota bacterium]|nr:MBL fold metallo-hydrolase [Actinomycetota bacterium]
MSLAVTVLGSSAMYATAERACSGYLVEADDKRIWMDAGGGTWLRLQGLVDQLDLDAVVLSHRHPDHVIDLFQCFHARRYGGPEPLEKIPLWAPVETMERLLGFSGELDESFEIEPVGAGGSMKMGGTSISFFEMAHPAETIGIRYENNGTVLAYSSDTGPGGDLGSLASGADLLICEATFQEADDEWDGHLTAAQAGRAAAEAEVQRLVLTHLPNHRDLSLSVLEAQHCCDGIDVSLAADLLRYEL